MPAGRPTEYNKSVLKKAQEYLDECEDEDVQVLKQANSEKGYEMYENKIKVNIPTIEGLALYLDIDRSTIYDWESKYQEFSHIIEQLRAKQAQALISKGLSGDYNSTIAKVLLSKHNYREATETDITSKGQQITGMQIINDDTVQDQKSKTASGS